MKNKQFFSQVQIVVSMALGLSIAVLLSCSGCTAKASAQQPFQNQAAKPETSIETEQTSIPKVYFTADISPSGLMAVYNALRVQPSGKVAVKISTGEPPNSNYLRPALIKDLVQSVNGTIVEST